MSRFWNSSCAGCMYGHATPQRQTSSQGFQSCPKWINCWRSESSRNCAWCRRSDEGVQSWHWSARYDCVLLLACWHRICLDLWWDLSGVESCKPLLGRAPCSGTYQSGSQSHTALLNATWSWHLAQQICTVSGLHDGSWFQGVSFRQPSILWFSFRNNRYVEKNLEQWLFCCRPFGGHLCQSNLGSCRRSW